MDLRDRQCTPSVRVRRMRWPGGRRGREIDGDVFLVEFRVRALVLFKRSLGGSGDLGVRQYRCVNTQR